MQVTNQKKAHLKYSKELNVRSLPHVPWLGIGIDRGSGPAERSVMGITAWVAKGRFQALVVQRGTRNGGDKVTDVCVQHVIHVCLGLFDVADVFGVGGRTVWR